MPRPLTEKTLELNIMAELAHYSRLAGHKPYFMGFSQIEEIIHGSDSFFNDGAMIGFFQFKRGYSRSSYFTFYINNNAPHYNQHDALCRIHAASGACKYVLPLIGTNEDVYEYRGHLLNWTPFLAPDIFNPLIPSQVPHRIRIYYDGTWTRYSENKDGNWSNIFGVPPENTRDIDELTQSYSRERQQYLARMVFDNLKLPKIKDVLEKLNNNEVKGINQAFEQRSSFCMVFNPD